MDDLIFKQFYDKFTNRREFMKEIDAFKRELKKRVQFKIIEDEHGMLKVPLQSQELFFLVKYSFQHAKFWDYLKDYLNYYYLTFSQYFVFRYMHESICDFILEHQIIDQKEYYQMYPKNQFFDPELEKSIGSPGDIFYDVLNDYKLEYEQQKTIQKANKSIERILCYSHSLRRFVMLVGTSYRKIEYVKAENNNDFIVHRLEDGTPMTNDYYCSLFDQADIKRFIVKGRILNSNPYSDIIFLEALKLEKMPTKERKFYSYKGIPLKFGYYDKASKQQKYYSKEQCEKLFKYRLKPNHQVILPNDKEIYYLIKPNLKQKKQCCFCDVLVRDEYKTRIGYTKFYNWMHPDCLHQQIQSIFQKRNSFEKTDARSQIKELVKIIFL